MSTATLEQKIETRFIPSGSREIQHRLGVAYVQESAGKFYVIAYTARASKRAFYESYRTAEARDKRVEEFFANLESAERSRLERRTLRSQPHTLKVGDIIHHSWGWEQTNCDYYQIVATTPHTITIRAISDSTVPESTYSHGMADMRVAVPDTLQGEEITLRANSAGISNKERGPLAHGCISRWDGKPNYCSWYA